LADSKAAAAMRLVSALLAVASVVATVKGYWLADVPRENPVDEFISFPVVEC
jgi:hypothetical protein